MLRRTIGERADVGRVRKLQIDERVFAVQLNLYYKGRADIVDLPIGSGEWLRREIRRAPENFPGFAFDFGRIEFKDSMIAALDEQESVSNLQEQRIVLLAGAIDFPLFRRRVIDAQEGVLDGLPGERLVFCVCGGD